MTDDPTFGELSRRLDKQDHVLDEILGQAKSTNGRVRKLEMGQAYARGAIFVLVLLITGIGIPLLASVL